MTVDGATLSRPGQGEGCSALFLDTSPRGTRSGCSMHGRGHGLIDTTLDSLGPAG